MRTFCPNQSVRIQIDGNEWRPAKVVQRLGESSNTYDIEHEGRIIRKHADHVQSLRRPIIILQQGNVSDKDPVRVRGEVVTEQHDPVSDPVIDPIIDQVGTSDENINTPVAIQISDKDDVNLRRSSRNATRVDYKMLNKYGKSGVT
jgi:hypothetical protein